MYLLFINNPLHYSLQYKTVFPYHTQYDNNVLTTKAEIKVDEKKCSFDGALVTSNTNPSITVDIKCTPNHHIEFNVGLTRVSERRHKAVLKLVGLKDYSIDASADATHESIENFAVIIDIDSPKAKLNKAHIEIQAKPNAEGRTFIVKASNDNKNILSGSATYHVKEEKGQTVVSGEGNVKLYDQEQKASFNLVRTNFEEARDSESGWMVSTRPSIICIFIWNHISPTNALILRSCQLACFERKRWHKENCGRT